MQWYGDGEREGGGREGGREGVLLIISGWVSVEEVDSVFGPEAVELAQGRGDGAAAVDVVAVVVVVVVVVVAGPVRFLSRSDARS